MDWLFFIIGTLLCTLGFWRRDLQSRHLLWPRIVVPMLIWGAIFLQFIVGLDDQSRFQQWRSDKETEALGYVCLCLVFFWFGFACPFGRWFADLFRSMPSGLYFEPERLRVPAFILCCIPTAIQFSLIGFGIFDASNMGITSRRFFMGPVVGRMVSITIDFLSIVGATLIGYSWPRRETRHLGNVSLHLLGLFLCAHIYFMRFSRASGLTFLMAFAAASMRFQKIHWPLAALTALLVMVTAHAGLTGRSIYGHFSGSVPYFKHLFTSSIFDWPDVLFVTLEGGDKLTPLTVVMSGTEVQGINELTRGNWMLTQVPVPRILGLPEWTADAAIIAGGHRRNPFNYTLTWFGDTYAHWGLFGAIFFFYPGVAYRFVDRLVSSVAPDSDAVGYARVGWSRQLIPVQYHFLNFYSLFIVMTYGALIRGIFNNYRAWNILFAYMFYGLVAGLLLIRWARGPVVHPRPSYGP